MEHSERFVYDADIHIDYINKDVSFKNQKSLKSAGISILRMSSVAMITIFVTLYWSALQHTYPYSPSSEIVDVVIYDTPWDLVKPTMLLCLSIPLALFLVVFVYTFIQSSTNPRIRDWVLNGKRKQIGHKTVIPNPSGIITYFTRNGEPLIDLEYNDDIASALVKSSLVKIYLSNEHKIVTAKTDNSYEMMVLTIELSRSAIGELVINEY